MEKTTIINELSLGRELTEQLKHQLNPYNTNSHQSCRPLIQKILSSYDNALSMLNLIVDLPESPAVLSPPPSTASCRKRESPPSDLRKDSCKKKKTMAQQVTVRSGTEVEDGFSWRKYGQKDILGAKFPRAYYRCTHRHGQGCLATKYVQRSDEDSSIFDISYKGRHTCIQSTVPKMDEEQEEDGQVVNHELSLGKEEALFGCLNFPFTSPENSESDDRYKLSSFPSFNFEIGFDYGLGEMLVGSPVDQMGFDENLSLDNFEFFDFTQNPSLDLVGSFV